MPATVAALESKRDAIVREMAEIRDMRRGSITEVFRPCGKLTCACQAAEHPGHGPYYAYTRKVSGKTKTVQLRAGPRLTRFKREVEAYRHFRSLAEQLIEVNESICDGRPDESSELSERDRPRKTSRRSSRRKSHKR
jgi:hypothetical protein